MPQPGKRRPGPLLLSLSYVQVGEINLEKYGACAHPRTQDNDLIVLRCSQDNSLFLGVSTV